MKRIVSVLALLCPFLGACQLIVVQGKVIDETGAPLAGATIVVKGTSRTTVSDHRGLFTLADTKLMDTLVVSAVGFTEQEMPTGDGGSVTVMLHRKVTSLQEVTVSTGYQTLPRERATGSFERLDNQLLSRRIGPDIMSRLEGVSTVYFDRRGQGRGDLSIRGRSTIFGDAAPLVVVDNFPYEGNVNDLNPNDVESITVLKDAAAASIWGVKAGNGVIVVTTKKAQAGRPPRLELNVSSTVGARPDLYYAPAMQVSDFIDVETFLFGKGFYNAELNNTTTRPPLSPVVELLALRRAGQLSAADSARGIDVLKAGDIRGDLERYFYRASQQQQYALSYSGAAGGLNYYFSGGHDRNNSHLVGNASSRTSLRSRLSLAPVRGWELWADMQYYHTPGRFYNGTNLTVGAKRVYPYARLAGENGEPLVVVRDYRQPWVDTTGGGKLLNWNYLPLEELELANNHSRRVHSRLAVGTRYRLLEPLSAELMYQYERGMQEVDMLYNEETYLVRNLVNRFYNAAAVNPYPVPAAGIADFSLSRTVAQAARGQLNYQQRWAERHELTALGGAELRQTQSGSRAWRVYGYSDELLTFKGVNQADNLPIYKGLSAPQPIPSGLSFSEELQRFVSVYGNAAYTYLRRYTASVSARKDASNLFGVRANQKGVPLWSAGLSWQMNREPFYRVEWLPLLKLRVTYGYSGNTDPSLAALTTIRYASGALFTNGPYARVQNPPNPELRWEKTALLNGGIDFLTANSRVEGSVEYYRKKGRDLIGEAPVDPTTGVLSAQQTFSFKGNVAEMKGEGVDAVVTSRNLVGRFRWTTHYLFSYAATRVTRYLLPATGAGSYFNLGLAVNPVEGRPLYTIYSYAWAGLDDQTGDPQGYLGGQVSKNYTALVNQPVTDLSYHGPAVPEYYGALRNEWGWKGFSLSANIAYKLGYYFQRSSINYNSLFRNWVGHPDYTLRWQKAGDEVHTQVPSLVYPNTNANRDLFYNRSQVLVERGDHVRLQDVGLSYEVSRDARKKLPVKQVRISLYANNLGILWKANGANLDPDYFSGGFPLPRTIALGLKTIF